MHHENRNVHPRVRTELGVIANALDQEHNQAYLQDDIHAEPIMRFFHSYFRSPQAFDGRGIRVVVYTRWDSEAVNPFSLAATYGRIRNTLLDPLDLELYNITGDSGTGTHYEPVFRNDATPAHPLVVDPMAASGSTLPVAGTEPPPSHIL